MKMFFALLLWVALATAAAAQPVIPIQVDLQAPQREFRTQWAGGSAPTLAVDIQNGGLPYPEISGWTGFVFVAITPTSGVFVADAGSTSNTVFFPFSPAQCATTGTFPAYVILGNGTNLYQFGAGRLTFTDSPALMGAGPINPLIPFNWDIYTFIGTPPVFGGSNMVNRTDADWIAATNLTKDLKDWVPNILELFANYEINNDLGVADIYSLGLPSMFNGDWAFENKPEIPGYADEDDLATRMIRNEIVLRTNLVFTGGWSAPDGVVWTNGNGASFTGATVNVGFLFPTVGLARINIPIQGNVQFLRFQGVSAKAGLLLDIDSSAGGSAFDVQLWSGSSDIPLYSPTSTVVSVLIRDLAIQPFPDTPMTNAPFIGSISVYGSRYPERDGQTNDAAGVRQRADMPIEPRDVANKSYVDALRSEMHTWVSSITPNQVGVTLDGRPIRFSPNWFGQVNGEMLRITYGGQPALDLIGGGTVTPQIVSMWLDGGTTRVRVVSSPIWRPYVEMSTNLADWVALTTNQYLSTWPHITNSTYVLSWVSDPVSYYRVIAHSTNAGDLGYAEFQTPVHAPSFQLNGPTNSAAAVAGAVTFANGQFYRCRTNGVWELW
ncbi:MAG: hypothetical protein J5I99_08940 [Verrucomicrobia bacterium]|nr:hypothetical protein [Verrucomicrobiota bacterium]